VNGKGELVSVVLLLVQTVALLVILIFVVLIYLGRQ